MEGEGKPQSVRKLLISTQQLLANWNGTEWNPIWLMIGFYYNNANGKEYEK